LRSLNGALAALSFTTLGAEDEMLMKADLISVEAKPVTSLSRESATP
jgi:hypothetical protein